METNVSQTSSKKISPQIQKMRAQIAAYRKQGSPLDVLPGEELISVDSISSQLSHFYEKMRYSVDYKEEHLLRRGAIKRMLKRRLQEQFRKGRVAPFLVVELVRAGYLPNNKLPERIINDVDEIIAKSLALYDVLPESDVEIPLSSGAFDQIIGMAAMEIEEYLFPQDIGMYCLDALYMTVYDLVEVRDRDISDTERNLQTYIACMRALLGYDESDLFYKIWVLHHPQWVEGASDEEIIAMGQNFESYGAEITQQIKHPLQWRILPKIRDYAIYFSLMRESAETSGEIWSQKQLDIAAVKKNIDDILARKYDLEKKRIAKSVSRVIVYILLTKTILAFAIELPYDIWAHGEVNRTALLINIFFHPFVLFVATRVVRLPRLDSKTLTTDGIISVIENHKFPQIIVSFVRKKSLFGMILSFIYLFFFALIFGAIVWLLRAFDFNIVSGGLFVFFLTLVSYFALRIRGRAKKWRVTSKSMSAKDFFVDLMTLPIVQSGQWITKKFESVNIFVFIMDFLIETPFKVLIDIFEGFTHYLREKKERLE